MATTHIFRKDILAILSVLLCFNLSVRAGELTRKIVSPVRIVWTQGDVTGTEALMENHLGQTTFDGRPVCKMLTTEGHQASILIDFGKEFQGGLQLVTTSNSTTAARVRIRFGESVSEAMSDISEESGATNDHAMRDFVEQLPWFGTKEFGNSGFRFVRIDVLDNDSPVELAEANGLNEYRDIPYVGSFNSDDERLNQIWLTGAYTVHQNMQRYIWDGIKRDRLVWIGDMHPEVMCINSVFGDQDVVEKSLDLSRDCFPLPGMMNGMSAYSLWWLIIQKDWYMNQGDETYLLAQKDYMKGLVDVLIPKIGTDGRDLINDHFLDWPSNADANATGAGFHALFILAMEAASQLFIYEGEKEYADKCSSAVRLLRMADSSIAKDFFAEGKCAYDPGRKQAVALMCLADMITPEQTSPALLEGGALGFSTFYGYYMLEALAKCGKYKEALKICSDFWGGMLDLGATTFWEDFDIRWLDNAARIDEITPEGKTDVHLTYGGYCYKKLRHSFCHGWASGPTSFMSRHILGVEVLEPGCHKVRITPNLADLQKVEGTYPTPLGPISITAEKTANGKVKTTVNAPKGVKIIK